ncbi:hypothetical protein ACEPAI_9803 [Sanghuangporus weigelae]
MTESETETKELAPRGHVISLNMPTWGHTKSACALLQKIVRQQPVYATLYTATPLFEKVVKELDTQFLPGIEDGLRNLIRVVALETSANPFDLTPLNEGFINEYRKILDTAESDTEPGPPQLILLDFFLYGTLTKIREVSGDTIPIYALISGSIATALSFFGPDGRFPQLVEELEAIPKTDKAVYAAEATKIYTRTEGKIKKLPGIPPMYDHELMPQKVSFTIKKLLGQFSLTCSTYRFQPFLTEYIVLMLDHVLRFLRECDGAVTNSTYLFEGDAIRAFEEWFGGRPSICPGPFDYPVIKQPQATDPTTVEVQKWLDSILEKYGSGSLVYISPGSQFWPSEPEKLWAILDVLIEQKVPFILSHASPFAVIPDEIKEKIKSCGFGYSSNWLPQISILNHKACGWMLTHAGQNSITEALSAGVPMICWPFDADQPVNAVYIAFVLNVGYELFEVRTDAGLRPVHRLGDRKPEGTVEAVKREFSETLEKMKGEDGAVKRANARKLQSGFAQLWAPDGENWKEIKKVTDILRE